AGEVSVDRPRPPRRHGRQLWRLHDELDRRPYDTLQGGGDASQHLEFRERRRYAGWRVRTRRRFRRRYLRETRALLGPFAAALRRQGEDADAGAPFGQRLPRADRAGRAVVPRAAALQRAERNRVLPAREPQPDAHGRAETPGRKPELA